MKLVFCFQRASLTRAFKEKITFAKSPLFYGDTQRVLNYALLFFNCMPNLMGSYWNCDALREHELSQASARFPYMWTSIFMDLYLKIYSSPLLHTANVACASARECEVHESIYRKGMGWSLLSCLFCSLCTGPESFYREFAFEVPTPTAQQEHKSTLTNSSFTATSSKSKETGEFSPPNRRTSSREAVKDPSPSPPWKQREESPIPSPRQSKY